MEKLIAKDRFKQLADMWYLREPAFFAVYCINELTENPYMNCAIRCGQGRIEYNADYIKLLTDNQLEELMKTEMIRVFLKHPYSRRPINCPNEKMIAASDMTLYGHYKFEEYRFVNPADFGLESGKFYEWYLMKINDENLKDSGGDSNDGDWNNDKSDSNSEFNTDVPGNMSDRAALWEEDDERCDKINGLIEQINSSKSWGSIPGNLTEKIIASSKAKIDYRKTLSGFRASILSSKRHLTRMRPNRRFEFQQMGSKYDLETRLLIAVDTSLSVTHTELANFFGVMRRMFRYGVSKIDVIQFDCQLQTPQPISIKDAKQMKCSELKGRGGTEFQVAFDYLQNHNVYDGMIIFTDGYAPQPKIDFFTRTKFVWVLTDEKSYDENKEWMRKIGRVCYINVK
ncbi:MAG: VWA-like domain-containing protein [Paludibacteraceae bacterium]|nr:VWA-like domain-containing protein [Paludibacteraceae bacterium]